MRYAIIAVLVLASGSSMASQTVVRPIGLHQYVITDGSKQAWTRAYETCAKLGRMMRPLGVPPEEVEIPLGKQFKFECLLPYEIVPSGQNTYKIWVPTEKIMLPPIICRSPPCRFPVKKSHDLGPNPRRLARTYCAKMHNIMVVTDGRFDIGTGFMLVFKCAPPQYGALAQPTKVYLTISNSGICSVDGHDMKCSDISRYLHGLNIQHGCHILIRADQRARYAYIVEAVKSLQAVGGPCKIGTVVVTQRQ